MQAKKDIRKDFLAKRRSLSVEEVENNSKIIVKKIIQNQKYKNANIILLYSAFDNEVLCLDLLEDALESGKKVAFPKVMENEMKFLYVTSIDDFEKGYCNILEPKLSLEMVQNNIEGVIIVPGVVFDKSGYRIGYGKGFYDKFLAQNKSLYSIGIAHSIQIFDNIPIDEYDQQLSKIITEKEEYCFD